MDCHAANCGQLNARGGNPFFFFLGSGGQAAVTERERESELKFRTCTSCARCKVLHLPPFSHSSLLSCCQVFFQLLFLGVIFIFIFIFMGITIKCLGYLFDTLLEQFQLPEVISLSARGEPRSQPPTSSTAQSVVSAEAASVARGKLGLQFWYSLRLMCGT